MDGISRGHKAFEVRFGRSAFQGYNPDFVYRYRPAPEVPRCTRFATLRMRRSYRILMRYCAEAWTNGSSRKADPDLPGALAPFTEILLYPEWFTCGACLISEPTVGIVVHPD